MAFTIKHPDILTPENKLDDVIYSHEHDITGEIDYSEIVNAPPIQVGTPELIDAVSFINRSSDIVFPDLDGNSDGIYKIVFNGKSDTQNPGLSIRPNNISTGFISLYTYLNTYDTNYQRSSGSTTGLFLVQGGWNSSAFNMRAETLIFPKTGKKRISTINSMFLGTRSVFYQGMSIWDDTTTNITSLTVFLNNIAVSGTLELWKIPLPTYRSI